MVKRTRYSPEERDRAVRLVHEHEREDPSQWAATSSIAAKIGCSAQTLSSWSKRHERDAGRRPGLTTDGTCQPYETPGGLRSQSRDHARRDSSKKVGGCGRGEIGIVAVLAADCSNAQRSLAEALVLLEWLIP